MGKTIEALFDGAVFRPVEPLTLKPNTRVLIVIETTPPTIDSAISFLRTARSLNLDGPPDWSANLENYLYGDKDQDAE
jgi:predicted DNA-binding antitoxin AbrB/MazE fold protein